MWRKFLLYFHTLHHLKWIQIYYRAYYLFRAKWRLLFKHQFDFQPTEFSPAIPLNLHPSIVAYPTYSSPYTFRFLNQSKTFSPSIDWNDTSYGKLWTYNLNYFEFLLQRDLTKEQGLELINDFIENINLAKDGFEPYPISLRTIFWLRFLARYKIQDAQIDQILFGQLRILLQNLEYHIMGNHLLENGFALLFGGIYFDYLPFYKKAEQILKEQLTEQILDDGGHFERSPMYHQIILYRLLDSINLLKNNSARSSQINSAPLLTFLQKEASKMLNWLQQMTWKNGTIPLFKDSARGIAPTTSALTKYAIRLNISPTVYELKDSFYRRFTTPKYDLIGDFGGIGPKYINGHAHSDHLSFSMQINGQDFIIDTGISTYEKNKRRQLERSTTAHNTVQIGNEDQSKVWGGFRVAQRAKVTVLKDEKKMLIAQHDGYKKYNIIHQRLFQATDNQLIIKDQLKTRSPSEGIARFHFHPKIQLTLQASKISTSIGTLTFSGIIKNIEINTFQAADQYNQLTPSKVVKIVFQEQLQTSICL